MSTLLTLPVTVTTNSLSLHEMSTKINIRNLSVEELKTSLQQIGEKPFRGKQIYEWLWQKNASSFEDMSNLSKALREKLELAYYIDHIALKDKQINK